MDFVKKLKASTPDYEGDEAKARYIELFENPVLEHYVLFHSSMHGRTEVLKLIEKFISSCAKVGIEEDKFIFSKQPLYIGRFATEFQNTEYQMGYTISYMVYSNCIVCYFDPYLIDEEGINHNLTADYSIHIERNEWELFSGAEKQER